ncbi:MAG: NF038132 family protein [Candidatus Accumulibacter sp.]|jgi:hypothetical protein|nr:NF038132 family protein [Accumulibacter sp.]
MFKSTFMTGRNGMEEPTSLPCQIILLKGDVSNRNLFSMKTTKSSKIMSIAAAAFFLAILVGEAAAATMFDAGIPTNWTHIGGRAGSGFGAAMPNGDVQASPEGGGYGYVTTAGALSVGNNQCGGISLGLGVSPENFGCEKNGSLLQSSAFSASKGDDLQFYFNYITSDGANFSDYAWVRLINTATNDLTLLFTARTTAGDNTVPGSGMPGIDPNVTIGATPIQSGSGTSEWETKEGTGGGPKWHGLDTYSGLCYDQGCGLTGWIQANYEFVEDGAYIIEFGVVNWGDTRYDSGLAFDAITLNGRDLVSVPEPVSLALFALGLAGLAALRRRA